MMLSEVHLYVEKVCLRTKLTSMKVDTRNGDKRDKLLLEQLESVMFEGI